MKFSELYCGQEAIKNVTITTEMVEDFAVLSTDINPIHIDDEYANKSIFKKKIVHGVYVASFISSLIANTLPGEGSIYLGQNLSFLVPVFHDETLLIKVVITKLRGDKNLVYLSTTVWNSENVQVIDGDALIKLA